MLATWPCHGTLVPVAAPRLSLNLEPRLLPDAPQPRRARGLQPWQHGLTRHSRCDRNGFYCVSGESPLAKDCDGAQGDAPRGVLTCSQDRARQSPQTQRLLLEALENASPPLIQELTGTRARLGYRGRKAETCTFNHLIPECCSYPKIMCLLSGNSNPRLNLQVIIIKKRHAERQIPECFPLSASRIAKINGKLHVDGV